MLWQFCKQFEHDITFSETGDRGSSLFSHVSIFLQLHSTTTLTISERLHRTAVMNHTIIISGPLHCTAVTNNSKNSNPLDVDAAKTIFEILVVL